MITFDLSKYFEPSSKYVLRIFSNYEWSPNFRDKIANKKIYASAIWNNRPHPIEFRGWDFYSARRYSPMLPYYHWHIAPLNLKTWGQPITPIITILKELRKTRGFMQIQKRCVHEVWYSKHFYYLWACYFWFYWCQSVNFWGRYSIPILYITCQSPSNFWASICRT